MYPCLLTIWAVSNGALATFVACKYLNSVLLTIGYAAERAFGVARAG